jgi:Holliday junction resolvase RusA-like endonuclease
VIRLDIIGTPAPQGSKSAFVDKAGRARQIEGSSDTGRAKLKDWRRAVALAAAEVPRDRIDWDAKDPVAIEMFFVMPRPMSAPKRSVWANKRPDVDKLLRATTDSLADGGLLPGGDGRVVTVYVQKRLAEPNEPTGAVVLIGRTLAEPLHVPVDPQRGAA